jgi:pimeloyl-ACP methyl ester carboxylesterase/DNA-binding winged helix-turn-helix (wHTH) protein
VQLRFGNVEIDRAGREVRVSGTLQRLQPQIWALLDYLLSRTDRVVTKEELLSSLWGGTKVTEGSLQRAVSLARAALGERGHELLRTFPKQGYRFVAPAESPGESAKLLMPRYAENGGVHLAYYTVGEVKPGGVDFIYVSGWIVPSRLALEHPKIRSQIERLATLGRVVLFDKRGTGQSDRPKVLPNLHQRMQDLAVVLDAIGSERTILFGVSEGGPLSLLFAATYPERTLGLVLFGAFPRMSVAQGYPHGWSREAIERLKGYIRRQWGEGGSMLPVFGSGQVSDFDRVWCSQTEQQGASPGAALELLQMNLEADVRDILASVRVPVHLVHSVDDRVMSVEASRYLARNLPDARYEELAGSSHAFFLAPPEFAADRARKVLEGRELSKW